MPQREPAAYLLDLVQACDAIALFIENHAMADLEQDLMLRSAVERQLMIVGESVVHLKRLDEQQTQTLGPVRSIIAFRNILVHGYFALNTQVVWTIASNDLPLLREKAQRWLDSLETSGT